MVVRSPCIALVEKDTTAVELHARLHTVTVSCQESMFVVCHSSDKQGRGARGGWGGGGGGGHLTVCRSCLSLEWQTTNIDS